MLVVKSVTGILNALTVNYLLPAIILLYDLLTVNVEMLIKLKLLSWLYQLVYIDKSIKPTLSMKQNINTNHGYRKIKTHKINIGNTPVT